jgi:hypothetical protein
VALPAGSTRTDARAQHAAAASSVFRSQQANKQVDLQPYEVRVLSKGFWVVRVV